MAVVRNVVVLQFLEPNWLRMDGDEVDFADGTLPRKYGGIHFYVKNTLSGPRQDTCLHGNPLSDGHPVNLPKNAGA